MRLNRFQMRLQTHRIPPHGRMHFSPQKLILPAILGLPTAAHAAVLQGLSPWEQTINTLQLSFTGPIARGLSLVAVVIGGLMYAFGEGQSKRTMAGLIFGVGMALAAVNFVAWLFPGF